jgi:hypothetical protein
MQAVIDRTIDPVAAADDILRFAALADSRASWEGSLNLLAGDTVGTAGNLPY